MTTNEKNISIFDVCQPVAKPTQRKRRSPIGNARSKRRHDPAGQWMTAVEAFLREGEDSRYPPPDQIIGI